MGITSSGIFLTLKKKPILVVSSAQFIRVLARSQVWIFIPVYLSLIRHIPVYYTGILFFITAMMSLPVSVYGGNLIDKIGRRKISSVMPLVLAFVFLITYFSISGRLNVIYIYLEFVIIEPLTAIQGIADNVIITDVSNEAERMDAFGILRMAGNLGFSIGPALGGFLSELNYSYIFLFTAIAAFIEFIIYIAYMAETKPAGKYTGTGFEIPWRDRLFIFTCLLISLVFFVSGQWGTTLTLFWSMVDHVGNGMIGVLYSVNGLVVLFLQLPIIRIIKRLGDMTQVALGGFIYSVSFFALAFFSSFAFLIIDVIVITIGENIISPVSMNIVGKLAPPEKRGQYYGTFQLMNGLITPAAPILGTALLYKYMAFPVNMWGIIFAIGISLSAFVYFFGKLMLGHKNYFSSNRKLS